MALASSFVHVVERTGSARMTRGVLLALVGQAATLARPIAIALFSRLYGADALGGLILIWACVELGARLATLGLDRGVQRQTDDTRIAAAAAGMTIVGITGLSIATVLCVAVWLFAPLGGDMLLAALVVLLFGIPLTAIGNVALRATRGTAQITTYVLARGVTEPLLFLFAGLAFGTCCDGSVALPAALTISIIGGAVVAAFGIARTIGLRELAISVARVHAWPLHELVRTSVPLGFADLLQAAQARLDLVVIALVTSSTTAITQYAVAAEIASVFISIRFALDQVVAPLAAEARGNRAELLGLLATMMRWSSMLAVPVALLVFVGPEHLMRWFGGTGQAVPVLLVLASGRAFEMVAAPAASMLAIVGAPKLSLLDAAIGIAIALLGQIAAAATRLGPTAIAVASAAGMVVSSLAAVMWLSRRYGLAI